MTFLKIGFKVSGIKTLVGPFRASKIWGSQNSRGIFYDKGNLGCGGPDNQVVQIIFQHFYEQIFCQRPFRADRKFRAAH